MKKLSFYTVKHQDELRCDFLKGKVNEAGWLLVRNMKKILMVKRSTINSKQTDFYSLFNMSVSQTTTEQKTTKRCVQQRQDDVIKISP